jgi:hypothetical protein
MNTLHLTGKRSSTKEKLERHTSMKAEEAWNGLYLAAAADDDNTTFKYITNTSVASTMPSPCYSE